MNSVPKPSKKYKESRPKRDEFELEELAEQLIEAKENKTRMNFLIYKVNEPLQGIVKEMDPRTQKVHIYSGMGVTHKIPFIDILKIDNTE